MTVRHDEPGTGSDAGTNVVLAADGVGRISEQIQLNGMISTSHDRGKTGVAAAYFAGRDAPSLYTGILGALVTADYNPRTGFVSRPDVLVTSPAVSGKLQPDWRPKGVVWFKPTVITYFYNDPKDFTLQEGWIQAFVDVLHRSGALWYSYVERHLQRPTADFAPLPGVTIAAGRNDYWRYGWYGSTDRSAKWTLSTNVSTGGYFDGRRDRVTASARLAPSPYVAFNVDLDINALHDLGMADTSLTTRLIAPELRVALSPQVQLATFYQYNTAARRGALNARFSWEFAPLSYLYVVYKRLTRHPRRRHADGPRAGREARLVQAAVGRVVRHSTRLRRADDCAARWVYSEEMRRLTFRMRALAALFALFQAGAPALVIAADSTYVESRDAGAHIEDQARRNCAPAHQGDCDLCRVLTTAAAPQPPAAASPVLGGPDAPLDARRACADGSATVVSQSRAPPTR